MGLQTPPAPSVLPLTPILETSCSVQWMAASICLCICQALAKHPRRQLCQAPVSKHFLACTIVSGFGDCICLVNSYPKAWRDDTLKSTYCYYRGPLFVSHYWHGSSRSIAYIYIVHMPICRQIVNHKMFYKIISKVVNLLCYKNPGVSMSFNVCAPVSIITLKDRI